MRAAVRFPLQLPVKLHADGADVDATTIDISSTGMLFTVDRALQVGSTLDWELRLPAESMGTASDITVTCHGSVVRVHDSSPVRMAVQIDEYQVKEHAR